jgi:hypothetical protein
LREGQEIAELSGGDQTADLRLVDRMVELVGHGGSQISDRAGGCGELEVVARADVFGLEGLTVDFDA